MSGGVTFLRPTSTRTSKVFQFFWVSETSEKVLCLKCHKVLKGINTRNCVSHLSVHDSPLCPEIQAFLRSLKGKQDEKEEAEHKALTGVILCWHSFFPLLFSIFILYALHLVELFTVYASFPLSYFRFSFYTHFIFLICSCLH